MKPSPRIAFLGTGLMGAPMCQNLLSAGLPLTVWNRSLAKAEPLAKRGAIVADSPQSAASDADVVITMLSDGPAVSEVMFEQGAADAIREGATRIDMGSIGADEAIDHAKRHSERGVRYLDAPVSGGTRGAAAGELAIMAGGNAETFAAMQPVFAPLGQATHVGPNGCGQLAKLANQVIVAITIGAVSEALILAGGGGADRAKVREALQGGFASSRILTEHGQRMVKRNFEPGGPAKFQLKDLHNALSAADRLGLDLPITKLLHGLFDAMVQSGKGDMDHSGLLTHLEAFNNINGN
ncbi:MAG: NAD(P)-dependent oxidoreductase [Verrucomicrobiota bacterium]|jgi:2-hydroxy-3-oxopropionate reductase|nr:NAD(P)-dependent oxidoreductase [Verrucomicrobiota bacterium]|tara:strand:+ start:453 stop:1340 length:888 start_codon:yes stop_codon:yes gene_type:complete